MAFTPEQSNTILVIEDDGDIRESLRDILELEGFHVLTAADGLAGLEQLRTGHPSLVVLDMMMPIMDGREFLDRVRDDPGSGAIPVVVLSATATMDEARRANEIIAKPPDIDRLMDAIYRNWQTRPGDAGLRRADLSDPAATQPPHSPPVVVRR